MQWVREGFGLLGSYKGRLVWRLRGWYSLASAVRIGLLSTAARLLGSVGVGR
jgi:hypothetical protein